jgi:Complex I intermediate-associated protein 30 (CIA30)
MAKWDAGRFLNTVSYFEAIPIVSDLRRWLTGGSGSQATNNYGGRALGVVLVVGATSEIGGLVIQQLVKSGYRVRGILSDLTLVPFSVPTNVEFVQAQLDRQDPLTPELMQGVRSIIVCPEPQNSLSSAALQNLTRAASAHLSPAHNLQLFDFTQPTTDLQATWGAVDDVVMGGVSESGIRLMSGYADFSGNVSTDNSGGFASVRTRNFDPSLNLSNYRGIELRVKGDGQRYKIFVRTEAKWDGIGYAHSFDTVPYEWMTVRVPFRDLVPIFRAKTVKDAQPIDLSQICSLQLMLSKFEYDSQLNPHFNPGLFSLQIESILAYDGKITPQLVLVDPSQFDPALTATLQATQLPYSIVKSEILDPQMVALICVKSLTQPETVGQILGR